MELDALELILALVLSELCCIFGVGIIKNSWRTGAYLRIHVWE